jgi:hypothetical protein
LHISHQPSLETGALGGRDAMTTHIVASISLSWDDFGRLSHSLSTFVPADDYQKADVLAFSVPLITASQLGVLTPHHSIGLCGQALNFLSGNRHVQEVIPHSFKGARIDLHAKGQTIVCTFHPTFIGQGEMEYDEAVRRLLSNYSSHINSTVIDELSGYMRNVLLAAVRFYLSSALAEAEKHAPFSPDIHKADIQFTMLSFCESIYPLWQSGPSLTQDRFASNLLEAQRNYQRIRALM